MQLPHRRRPWPHRNAPEGPVLDQRQAFLLREAEVAVLTLTTHVKIGAITIIQQKLEKEVNHEIDVRWDALETGGAQPNS